MWWICHLTFLIIITFSIVIFFVIIMFFGSPSSQMDAWSSIIPFTLFIGDPPFYLKSPHLPSASFPSSVALKLQLRVKCRRREFKVARPARRPLKHPPRPGVDGPPTRICTKRDIHTLFYFCLSSGRGSLTSVWFWLWKIIWQFTC